MNEQLYVFSNDYDWVCAASASDATAVAREHSGDIDSIEEGDWEQLPDDKVLSCNDDGVVTKKTCREWVESEGRGFLFSTEF